MNTPSITTLSSDRPTISRLLTRILWIFIPECVNVWLRFGQPIRERFIDRYRREVDFIPGQIIGRVEWQANDYGTTLWRFKVLQTVEQGQCAQIVTGVAPVAEILLSVSGAAKVQHALTLIDRIEAQGIVASDVSETYWHVAHNRYAGHLEPPLYDIGVHTAYRMRQTLERA